MNRINSSLLILLWTYTGLDKILRLGEGPAAFMNKTFPVELTEISLTVTPE